MDAAVTVIMDEMGAACQRRDAPALRVCVDRLRATVDAASAGKSSIGPALAFGALLPVGDQLGTSLLAVGLEWALPQLDALVCDESPAIRCVACRVLGQIGAQSPEAIIAQARLLATDPSWEVREFLANALDEVTGATQGDAVYALMQEWVHDADANVRRVPTNALMRYGRRYPQRVIGLMRELLHDDSHYVRDNVVFCLGVMGAVRVQLIGKETSPENPQRLLAVLREWLSDDDERTRWIISRTLGRSWVKACLHEALDLLRELEKDERRSVRVAVASSRRELAKRGTADATVEG